MTDVDPGIVDRQGAEGAEANGALQYVERPQLAFIVHSFNRISNLEQIFRGLRSLGPHELIVCDDGSVDGSHQRWLELLNRPNDFLIHSNDLHEIRATDRAIRYARSEIVCLVQDDDLIPAEASWLDAVLSRVRRRSHARDRRRLHGVRQLPPRPGEGSADLGRA